MATTDRGVTSARRRRADAQRNERILLEAAASVFITSGIDAPVRDIAAAAAVGMGTIYRHFPTRVDLVIAVYRHQLDACEAAGPQLLASMESAADALAVWLDIFVDFLVTKHGLAALRADPRSGPLLAAVVEQLVPVGDELLTAAKNAGEIDTDLDAFQLMRGIGNLCISSSQDSAYDPRQLVTLLVAGLMCAPRRDRSEA